MTRPGASRSPQPAAVRNRLSGVRPGTGPEKSVPAVPLQCARSRYMAFLGAVKMGITAAALTSWYPMTASAPEQGSNVVWVNRAVSIAQSQESGVTTTEREYKRYIERLDRCKPHGWSDLWLAVAGIGGGLSGAAIVTTVALPSSTPAAGKDILWMLTFLGAVMLVLCLMAYFSQRLHHAEEIDDLKKDFQMQIGSSA